MKKLGWYSRGYIPHFDGAETQSITWRLADSYPAELQRKVEAELESLKMNPYKYGIEKRKRDQHILDLGFGECHLKNHDLANMVQDTLLFHEGERFHLHAWCVMPNHVHVLVTLKPEYPLRKVLQSWRSFSAHEANKMLGRKGSFWFRDPWDRFIRNQRHFGNARHYIEQNPVTAGLCEKPEEWPYGSAKFRAGE